MGRLHGMGNPTSVRLAVGVFAYFACLHILWPLKPGIIAQGIVIGGLTALIAFGIALVYRANRIVNFAQGDLGAVPATLAVLLIVGPRWPFLAALPVSIAAAALLGIAVERLVIRRFANAPRLILTVATIGLAQVLAALGLMLPNFFRLTVPPTSYPSPIDVSFTIDPITFKGNDVLAMIVIPVVMVGLAGLLRYTDLGIAIRASAERATRASLLGVNVPRVRVVVWILASALATVAMLLRAGIVGLPIGNVLGPTILLRALAAAVIGRMERLPTILFASMGLGIIESAIIFRSDSQLISPVTFLVLLVTLAVQHRDRITRFVEASAWRVAAEVRPIPKELAGLPEVRWGRRIGALVLLAGAVTIPAFLDDGNTNRAGAILILGIVAISLVVLTGWAGQVSLGQVAFLGIGAAVGGAITANLGWDIAIAFLLAGLAGAAIAVVVGIPALRVSGLQLAVATLAFALAVHTWVLDRQYNAWLPTLRIPRTKLFGQIDLASETRYFYLCLAVFVAVYAMARSLRNSRTGRVLVAMRENERAAQAFGVNATRTKLTGFAFSGFFAALGGAVFVHHQQSLGISAFAPEESLRAFAMVIIGGLGSLPGALLGAMFVESIDWISTIFPRDITPLVAFLGTGVGTLAILMVLPGGLGALLYSARDAILRRIAARRGIVVPSLMADVPGDGVSGGGAVHELKAEEAVLSVRDLEVGYDGVQVVFGVDLHVDPGEIVALLGTNGAGKSTVLNAISGVIPPLGGSVWVGRTNIAGKAPHDIAALGVVQSPGDEGVFPSLSVNENLRIATWLTKRRKQDPSAATARILELFPELEARLDTAAGNLSGGEQQMLTLAMSFLNPPKLLMIDELSLGLAPRVVERLLEAVRVIRDEGTAIVLVEQSVNVALTVAHRAYFLEKGEVRFHGATQELLERPDILRSVFLEGGANGKRAPIHRARIRSQIPERSRARPILDLVQIGVSFGGVRALTDLSLSIAPSEIVGVIGPNGAGKTTMFDVASGFLAPDEGDVLLHGEKITGRSPDERARAGLGRSFQDARLFPGLTVREAIAVGLDREVKVRDPVAMALRLPAAADSERNTYRRVEELIELMHLGSYRDRFIGELSTGTRRIVDLACTMAHNPSVILFDEPTSGIAQREAEELAPLLMRLRDETGAALLVIEHDVALVTGMSDRMVALDLGEVIAEGAPRAVIRDPAVVMSYLGGGTSAELTSDVHRSVSHS